MENVILYHQKTCGQCKAVEMLLKKANIEYESCEDVEAMKQKGILSTPTLEVNGELKRGKDIIDWIKGKK